MTISASFVLLDDKIAHRLWAFLKSNWRAMAEAGTPLVISISEYKSKRSLEQNKYYWRLLENIARNAWVSGKQFSAETWHEQAKRLFIGMIELPDGSLAGMSTTGLNVAEFHDYITQIESYATAELGIELEQ